MVRGLGFDRASPKKAEVMTTVCKSPPVRGRGLKRRLQARREELREYMVAEYRQLYRIDPQVTELNAVEAELKAMEEK